MSLRARLIWSVTLALLVGLALAGVLTIWQARDSVRREVGSALVVGKQTVLTAVEDFRSSGDPLPDLHRMIAAFNGNRHITVSLIDKTGKLIDNSSLASPVERVPAWFVHLVRGKLAAQQIELPTSGSAVSAVRLEGDPRNEILEVWNSLRDTAIVILVLCLATGSLIWWSIGRALRPLGALSNALESVGSGEFNARLAADGLPETRVIAAGFNRMAADLSVARERNRALHKQLVSMQEVERSEIARDLHDDIGPLLFAITVDAAAIERALPEGGPDTIRAIARGMRDAVQQAHTQVRAIVNRLRPVGLTEFGIARAVENLIEFWRPRHPGVAFTLDLPDEFDSFGDLLDITAFRVVQEALNNALRHGQPSRITVVIRLETGSDAAMVLTITDDGTGSAALEPGFGLTGMRDRVEAAGGTLRLVSEADRGFILMATLPLADPLALDEPRQLSEIIS